MKQKIQTLAVALAIILAAVVQTELNQQTRVRQLNALHGPVVTAQLK